jgi:N-acetylglutamate synthase-like GNAT family acetyltransferase
MQNSSTAFSIKQIKYGSKFYDEACKLRFKILREPLGLKIFNKDFEADENQIHIGAFINKKIIGCVVLKPVAKTKLQLRQMAIDEEMQGKKMGQELVEFAEKLAKKKGYQEIEMTARISAIGFYEKLGYKKRGEEFMWESLIMVVEMFKCLV